MVTGKKGRAMINKPTQTKLFNVIFFVACSLVVILSGCSPFDGLATLAPTAQPTTTRTILSSQLSVTPSPTPQPTCTVTTGYDKGNLNLRRGAGTQYGVIRVLREGETLQVIARGAWLHVIDSQGTRGFVNSKFCK
jgi:uncharacterized protein YgiM (DUF1202 family)